MLRTFIQFTALWLTLISAIFLAIGSISLSVEDIAALSKAKYGFNLDVANNLAQQQAFARVGLFILLLSLGFQMLLMRWKDFAINWKGIIFSIIFAVVILCLGFYAAKTLQDRTFRKTEIILRK